VAQRVFRDQGGVEWVVVDVMPDVGNRRAGVDRRMSSAPEVVIERRRAAAERRMRARPRVLLGSDLERGWLYFQPDSQPELGRRRLAPIPPGWESLPEAELAALLAQARQVSKGARAARGGSLAMEPRELS
jgi:hypothetical protein